ncbi:dienelactone hydrolase [Gemmatimonadetes bacterium T265]|nr:dienelactone hydrolase [Gemmatimonadetes bacterium T265]
MVHDHGAMAGMNPAPTAAPAPGVGAANLPADAGGAVARLNASPRHGEYVTVRAGGDSVRAWVVYPQRSSRAPVVVVVHEIFGLSSWVRGVADQLAAEGYIAIAPDFLTDSPAQANPDNVGMQAAVQQISNLDVSQVQRRITMAADYATALPSALPQYGVVGFCWGGSIAFGHAVAAATQLTPALKASVVYYGTAPRSSELARERVPILGLFGGNDARVVSTLPPADSTLRALGRTHDFVVYPGAGHGFLRQQSDSSGANLNATRQAWPRTVAWFKQYLGA